MPLELEFHVKPAFFFKKFLVVIFKIFSDYHWISDAAPQEWSKVSCGTVNSLLIRFAWGI